MSRFAKILAPLVAFAVASATLTASGANQLYDRYRQSLVSWSDAGLSAAVDVKTDTIKAVLVTAGYAANTATDQFYSSVSANALGTPVALTWSSDTAGVYKASATTTFSNVPAGTATQIIIYKDTGTAGTSPLIARIDGKVLVTAAATASAGATTVTVDPLGAAIASGTAVAFSGGTTATTSANAAAGARSLTVTALAGGIAAGETAQATTSGVGLPVTSNGTNFSVTVTWDATNGIFKP